MDFGYSYYTPPTMKIEVEYFKATFGDGRTEMYVSVSPESISICGDWPDGINFEKMKKDISKAIERNLPKRK